MSVQDYIAEFDNLTLHCDVREHRSHTITRFVGVLRFKIKCAMISGSYDLDTIERLLICLKDRLDFQKVSQYQGLVFYV